MTPLHDDLKWLLEQFEVLSVKVGEDRNTRPEHDAMDEVDRERARGIIRRVEMILERTGQ